MYKLNNKVHDLKVTSEYLTKEQTVPQNTNVDGNQGPIVMEGDLASQEIIVRVGATAIAIADTASITVKLMHAPDNGSGSPGTYVTLEDTVFTHTAAGGSGAWAADAELARYVPPTNVNKYVKINIATTDAAATGTYTAYPTYLPR